MSDDDLIREALGADADPGSIEPGWIDGAIERGARRRRRRVWLASGACGCLIAGVGFALVAANRGSNAIVGDTPAPVATAPPALVPNTSAPASSTPTWTSAVATSTEPPDSTSTSSTSSTTVASVAPTTAVVAPPPTTPPVECPPEANITLDDVQFVVERPSPPSGKGFLVQRSDGYGYTSMIELWSEAGRAATLDETVVDPDDQYWCPTRLQPLGFDGRWIWVWTGSWNFCPECSVPRSQLIRADTSTGEVTILWASATGESVFDLVPDLAGGATIVTGISPDDLHLDVVAVAADGSTRTLSSWAASNSQVLSAALQVSSGRVAYTTGYPGPGGSAPELHIVGRGSDIDRLIPMTGWSVWPAVRGWEPVGDRLLVEDAWENSRLALVDLDSTRSGTELNRIGDAGCWMSDGSLAAGRWDSGYVENDWSSGTVEIIDTNGRVVADYGLGVVAGSLACLDDGRVAFTRFVKDFGSIVPGTMTVTIVGPDGSLRDITHDSLWVLGADAVA